VSSFEPGPTLVRAYTAWLEMNRYRRTRSPSATIACPMWRGTYPLTSTTASQLPSRSAA
jgi:hypothetical protein